MNKTIVHCSETPIWRRTFIHMHKTSNNFFKITDIKKQQSRSHEKKKNHTFCFDYNSCTLPFKSLGSVFL